MDKSMDTENPTDEQQNQSISKESFPAKIRSKERNRSQTTPTNTDINDPENLDYEDIDDNHPVKKINDEAKSSMDIQDEDGEVSNNPPEIDHASSSSIPKNPENASDEGEVDEADLEDGEIHDPSTSKNKNSSLDDQSERTRPTTGVTSPQTKIHCRYYSQGRCHWGPNCKYIHPNTDSTKNPLGASIDNLSSTNHEISPPIAAGIPMPQNPANTWISPQATTAASQFFPNPLLRGQAPPASTGTESAWERGLRSAKTLREQSMRRKQQDKDFNDKRFNLTIRDALDEKEIEDNVLNIDRPSSVDYDPNDYPDQRAYSDRYHPYRYSDSTGNAHYNNQQRMNNNSRHSNISSTNEHSDRRSRPSDDYNDNNRNRKEKSSANKDSKSTSKRDDSLPYKRNSSQSQYTSGSHHNNDEQLHLNNYGSRRGDDWHDPWDRSKNHGSSNRRSSGGGGRGPSYPSSASSSSSSRSRSHSTSSSSRSRSRSRSRPKRRSPSVTRATTTTKSSEAVKNGNEKKSNGNKKLVSPTSTTTTTTKKFLPGRQISSHTLKKAEKSSNTNKSSGNSHSKDQRGKDADINRKKPAKKENISRSDSTSSSSSSDSEPKRKTNRSSSSSSDSSSSENETRTKSKISSTGKSTTDNPKSAASRQLSSSSNAGKKSKNNSISQESSKSKETSAKKRRDTSSSTGSTNTTKKTKLNTDSHKSSTDASNAENSDSSKKKEKQNILKKLQEVEKLISQRSTKTST